MPKRGEKQTAAQKSAAAANLARGRAEKKRLAEEQAAKAPDGEEPMTAGERWSALLSGAMSVKDLDDEELANMRPRNKDGSFSGRGRTVPSHLAAQMHSEGIRRATAMFRTAAPMAVKRLIEIAQDPDATNAEATRALDLVLQRSLGRVPETIITRDETPWEALAADVYREGADRDSLADAGGVGGPEDTA